MFFSFGSENVLNNKKLLEILNFKDNKETKENFNEFLDPKSKCYLNIPDILTGGLLKYIYWNIQKVFINYTNLFINHENIENYGLTQRNNLITYLNAIKNKDTKILSNPNYQNIIQDIGLDYVAFDSKSNIFKENLNILQKWLDINIIKKYQYNNHRSLSLDINVLTTKIDYLYYKPNPLFSHIFSTFFINPYGVNFLFPFSIENILKNFNNQSIENFQKNQEIFYEVLKEKNYSDNENIKKFFQYGLLRPFYEIFKDLKVKPNKNIKESGVGFFGNKFKEKIDVENLNLLAIPDLKKQNQDEVKFLRNTILYNENTIQSLQNKEVFFLSYWITYAVSKFQDLLENNLKQMFDGIISFLTFTTQSKLYIFSESIIIEDEDNKRIVGGLHLLVNNMKNKKPLPFILIETKNFQIELVCKKFIYSLMEGNPYSISRIINPVKYTKYSLNKLNRKNYKPKEMKTLANKLFYENIKKFILFMKINFLYEEVKYLNILSLIMLNALRMANKIIDILSNLTAFNKTIFSVIEISGLELLCATRNEQEKRNTNSMCTSTFVTYVGGNLYTDKFLLAFTNNLQIIDEAVKSRFTIIGSISRIENLNTYIILIRRGLLKLMKINKNILSLDKDSFEKFVCEISYEFYVNNWTGTEINLFFIELADKNRLKLYNNQYNKETILKLMKEITL
jgi:hypothetical protein